MASEFYDHACDFCPDGTLPSHEWLFVYHEDMSSEPPRIEIRAMYPSDRIKEAIAHAEGKSFLVVRRAVWSGGLLPTYEQTQEW
jgi:hypothetical protein